ncbi:MAG: AI-2E family transporter [Gammaproteobacteria bacterium]|nr:MAG: AI-2E family transporter [Gammaproteobacteria bacterium]RLA23064.1 MAG: AI-2E family transporter [Gammaproteobacteria bacterium]
MQALRDWFTNAFSNPQVVLLSLLLILGFAIIYMMGNILAPVLASIVIAYLLEGLVGMAERFNLPRLPAVLAVYALFIALLMFVFLLLLPLVMGQSVELIQQFPNMISKGQEALMRLPEHYPNFISVEQLQEILAQIRENMVTLGQSILTSSASSVIGVLTVIIYLVLVPLMVFFFLKDKEVIVKWFTRFLPRERYLVNGVWQDVDSQIGNYVRGKFWEVAILFVASFITFSLMGMNYALLLGVLIGLSVIVPYVGATLVTIPVVVVGYFQWGWTEPFAYIMIAYGVIQSLDGVLLVPLLFSEVVNLHPVAIVIAILAFGGLWGLWGVFFAIPLATLVQAVLHAWPNVNDLVLMDKK